MTLTESIVEFEKILERLKDLEKAIKLTNLSYKPGEWNDISTLYLPEIYMEPCIFATKKVNSLSHFSSDMVTIGFISSKDSSKDIKYIYTNREDTEGKPICELLGKYSYVMKLSEFKW